MVLYLKKSRKSGSKQFSNGGFVFAASKLRSPVHGQNTENIQGRGVQGKQVDGSSLPLCFLRNSFTHSSLHRGHRQIPFVLPHTSPLPHIQESLPLVRQHSIVLSSEIKSLSLYCFGNRFRPFCKSVYSMRSDFVVENDGENGSLLADSVTDQEEVKRVCTIIHESFAFDRNMEAILDECRVNLCHELVLAVLDRFKHARKPAFRFFCWAAERPGFAHDARTYNAMMYILGKTRQFETMVSMLDEMGEKGLLTTETFSICIKAFAAAKERKKAVGIFDLMKKYNYKVGVDTVNCLLDALGRAKLGKEAQVLFEKLEHRFTPNVKTYTVLLNGWCNLKNLMEAGRMWNAMIDNGLKPDIVAHNIMLEGLLRCTKRSDAIKLFEVMKSKGPFPNARSYTILIRDLCKNGQMNEAAAYFDEMLSSGCEPDAATYTCLMTGFGNQKKMDMVYRLLKDMKEKGCPPDGRTYNCLIKLMVNQHMPDDAVKIYKKMIQNNIEPSIHTYNMMMKSYFFARDYEMGYAVWEEMKRKSCCPDENAYTVLIGGLLRQGRSVEACKYFEEMIDKGMRAPELDYKKLVADISRVGGPNMLEEITQKMKSSGKFEVGNTFSSWLR